MFLTNKIPFKTLSMLKKEKVLTTSPLLPVANRISDSQDLFFIDSLLFFLKALI